MEPQVHKQEQKHPLPLWMRWLIVCFVLLLIAGGTILWIIQGAQAIVPIAILTALGTLLAFFQFLPSLFPASKHTPSTKPPHSSQVVLGDEQTPSAPQHNQFPADTQTASPTVSVTVQTLIPTTSVATEEPHNEKNANKVAGTSPKVDWGEAPHTSQFYGRDKEIDQLKQWIMDDRSRMVAVLGVGGIGKTSLAATLVDQIQEEFDYVFWRSLQNAPPLKSILQECIKFISDQQQIDLPEDIDGQISILIDYLRKHRTLLILDNGESVLQAGDRAGQYRQGYEGYGKLLQRVGETKHQSCLLLTSREKPKEIARLEGNISPVHSLLVPGLEQAAGHQILKDKGLIESHEAFDDLIHFYSGNPLALKLVSASVYELFGGNIVAFLKEQEMSTDVQDLLDQQFQRLPLLERDLIYWLAIEREEVSLKDLQEDLVAPVTKRDLLNALASLRQRSLIETNSNGYFSLQPVILEYVTLVIVEQMHHEISSQTISIFVSHALTKAQSKAHVRDAQVRLIIAPIAERLLASTGRAELEKNLQSMLSTLRETQPEHSSYAVANTIHLLLHLQCNLSGYDFSHLVVRQAYLRGVSLSGVSFAHCNLIGSVFTETFGAVLSVTFSPVDNILAAGTTNGVRLWRTPNGTLLRSLQGHIDWVVSVAFSPDGKILATGSDDHTMRLWDVNTGQCLTILQAHTDSVQSITFNPNGRLLASGSCDQTVRIWDTNTGQCLNILQGHTSWVTSIALSSEGRLLASGSSDQTVRLWDTSTGQCLNILQGHTSWVTSIALSSDSQLLVSGSSDQTVRLWDTSTGQCLNILQGHIDSVRSVALSPDKSTLASSSGDRTVRLWDTSTGLCLKTLQGHAHWVRSVTFSPGDEILASGSEDQTVRLWDPNTGRCLNILQGYTNWVSSVAFSPDGKILVSGSQDQMVCLWDTTTGRCLKTLQGHTDQVWSVACSPDGKIVATGSAHADSEVRLWDTSTGQCLNILQAHEGGIWSVAFSPDSKIVATGSAHADSAVRLWDTSTGQCLNILQAHEGRVWSVAFSPDSKIVASGSDDQTVCLWDTSTGQCLNILQAHEGGIWSVAFSPDSKIIASGSDDQTVCLWDTSTGQRLNILRGHSERVVSVVFSPDGKILTSGSADQTLRLWDTTTGRCLKTLQGHTDQVWSVACSPDGKILASGSDDGTIKLWDVKTSECLQTLRRDRPYERMNITDVKGLTIDQKAMLKALGAIEDGEVK